jgi:hypothetical protein
VSEPSEPKLASLSDLRRALAAARERLAALAERVARVRGRLSAGRVGPAPASGAALPSLSPFGGADARPIEDLELTFRAVDVEAGGDGDKRR